jgi:hypothetical protein
MMRMVSTQTIFALVGMLVITAGACVAADKEHGTLVQESPIYVSPDLRASRVGTATRGLDTFLMERSTIDGKPWAHVLVTIQEGLVYPKQVSGWVDGRFVITPSIANGDQIIFGEAEDSERVSEDRNGRRHAGEDAARLYYRLYEYFPTSPLAGEALWHAADLRWQLEKAGVFSRPSASEMSPDARSEIDEDLMKEVQKKFPRTKWSDMAAYNLLDNKICGNWKGEPKCPEKESELYERYAREHPQSPKAAEALYNAAWRQAALVDIYKDQRQGDKAEKAKRKAIEIAQIISGKYPDGDWKPRAAQLIYALQQGLTTYTVEKSSR